MPQCGWRSGADGGRAAQRVSHYFRRQGRTAEQAARPGALGPSYPGSRRDEGQAAGTDCPQIRAHIRYHSLATPWTWHLATSPASVARDVGDLRLYRLAAGSKLPVHGHGGSELTLVLDGVVTDETGRYHVGDLQELDDEVEHQPVADKALGCVCLVASEGAPRLKGFRGLMLSSAIACAGSPPQWMRERTGATSGDQGEIMSRPYRNCLEPASLPHRDYNHFLRNGGKPSYAGYRLIVMLIGPDAVRADYEVRFTERSLLCPLSTNRHSKLVAVSIEVYQRQAKQIDGVSDGIDAVALKNC